VQAMADSTRRFSPLIADPWLLAAIMFHLTPLSTSFRSARFELTPKNQMHRIEIVRSEDNLHDFMHQKSFCKTGWLWMYVASIA